MFVFLLTHHPFINTAKKNLIIWFRPNKGLDSPPPPSLPSNNLGGKRQQSCDFKDKYIVIALDCWKASSLSAPTRMKRFLPKTMKAPGFCIHKNIGRHWGINTFSQSGLEFFLVFLAQPAGSAAVSGVVSLRFCEFQADSALAVVVVMTVFWLISIHSHSLRLLAFYTALLYRLWDSNYAAVESEHDCETRRKSRSVLRLGCCVFVSNPIKGTGVTFANSAQYCRRFTSLHIHFRLRPTFFFLVPLLPGCHSFRVPLQWLSSSETDTKRGWYTMFWFVLSSNPCVCVIDIPLRNPCQFGSHPLAFNCDYCTRLNVCM